MTEYEVIRKQAAQHVCGHPSYSLRESLKSYREIDEKAQPDLYGKGAVINDFEHQIAALTGKEKAVFFPSGTMAQQIVLRIACDEKSIAAVAYHPLCHIEIHEQGALQALHHINSVLLGEEDRLFTLTDLQGLPNVSAILFELPQREIGGQLPSWQSLLEMTAWCRERSIHCHLDGARLFEVLPYYEKTAAQVCALFDSVYLSFYKGLGGIAGAMLLGTAAHMTESKIWKSRYGGNLHQLFPYIVPAKYGFEQRQHKMLGYWLNTKHYAAKLNALAGFYSVPKVPVSNMFHLYFTLPADKLEHLLSRVVERFGIALLPAVRYKGNGQAYIEVWLGDNYSQIDPEVLERALLYLSEQCSHIENELPLLS